jgi:type I restriction enzyme R subunit
VLFLADRSDLGRQSKKEFDQYVSPYDNFKFGEEYIVQHLASNHLDRTARVVIATIQRLYSMLEGRELSEEDEDAWLPAWKASSRRLSRSNTTRPSPSRPST